MRKETYLPLYLYDRLMCTYAHKVIHTIKWKFLPRENISQKTSTISRIVYHFGNHIAVNKLALIKRRSLSNSSNVCNSIATHPRVFYKHFLRVYLLQGCIFWGMHKMFNDTVLYILHSVFFRYRYGDSVEEYCSSISCFLVFLVFCFASIQIYYTLSVLPM